MTLYCKASDDKSPLGIDKAVEICKCLRGWIRSDRRSVDPHTYVIMGSYMHKSNEILFAKRKKLRISQAHSLSSRTNCVEVEIDSGQCLRCLFQGFFSGAVGGARRMQKLNKQVLKIESPPDLEFFKCFTPVRIRKLSIYQRKTRKLRHFWQTIENRWRMFYSYILNVLLIVNY